ncbi:MAG TPA: hypothetical protein DCR20_06515 [Planctomycetaceae bacterium]|nr:hypothetical protein [Planctomycetaceae bacterium]
MRVEDCTVSVERRSLQACVDLAIVFVRETAEPILRLWLLCAVPACVLVWLLTSVLTDMLIPSILIFLFFSAVFNSLLVAAIGPRVFGEEFSVRGALRAFRRRFWAWLLWTSIVRFFQFLSGFCLLFPGLFVTAYTAYLPELLFLEQAPLKAVQPRLTWLAGSGGYGRSLNSLAWLMFAWAAASGGLFLLLDLTSSTVLNRPIFLQILMEGSVEFADLLLQLTHDDPWFLTVLQLCLWMPLPVIRTAVFFCYLDRRIRAECWDLQVLFRAEAVRVAELSG